MIGVTIKYQEDTTMVNYKEGHTGNAEGYVRRHNGGYVESRA